MSEEFVVHDRRLFGKDGQVNAETQENPATQEPETEDQEPAAAPEKDGSAKTVGSRGLPPPSFPSLLVGLATSALIHLGENPESGRDSLDLPAAKHTIDLLGILKIKTQGNLESEEEALLETLLYDLRLKFVKASQ